MTVSARFDQPELYTTRQRFILTDLIAAALPPEQRFLILDGGALAAFNDPRWRVFDASRLRLYGFEPNEAEVADLNRRAAAEGLDFRYEPVGLWSEPGHVTFYSNKNAGGGAFYEQNRDVTDRWKFQNTEAKFDSRDIFYPIGQEQWRVTSIDRWAADAGVTDLDFMKLNVQGAELEILQGSTSLLGRVIGVMAEMSFVESYRKRPMFADIDIFLRGHGFAFFDFIGHHYIGRTGSPITARHTPGLYPLHGQLIEGHGIYFRDPIDDRHRGRDLAGYDRDKLLKLVSFAEVFGQIEYAFELLLWSRDLLAERGDAAGATLAARLAGEGEALYRRIMGAR